MLAVVIVSWNVRDLLRKCLASLLRDVQTGGIETQVIVVDSASQDASAEMVRAEFPMLDLVACQENIGFVRGNNLALERLGIGDRRSSVPDGSLGASQLTNLQSPTSNLQYIWLLNPDTEVRPGATQTLIRFMQQHARCGLCGPKLLNPDGSLQHGAFAFPGLAQLALETQSRLWRFRGTRLDGRYTAQQYQCGEPFRIGHPLGAAMFARTEAVRQVGPLDVGFEMYAEEVDWAMRMQRAGWERWCVPAAEVVHYGGASSGQVSERAERIKWRSRQRYYAKYYSPLKLWLAKQLIPRAYRTT
jgi:N-acetylglucosaminyl-diphospho-decaprenol L-rhamnosyltransferase